MMTDQEWEAQLRAQKRYAWMTDTQWECFGLVLVLVGGEHHFFGTVKPSGGGLLVNATSLNLATFDFDALTRLVFMAHDRCVRVEVKGSNPGYTKIFLHKRVREGDMMRRHPTLEAAVEKWREKHPVTP